MQSIHELLERALAQIRNGADFRQVAATVSDAPDAVQGGLMGWREFVHGIYRTAALLKYALERKRPGLNLGGD